MPNYLDDRRDDIAYALGIPSERLKKKPNFASSEYFMGVDTASGQDYSPFRVHIAKGRRADGSYYYTATKQKTLDHKLEIIDESDSELHQSNRRLCLPAKSGEGVS